MEPIKETHYYKLDTIIYNGYINAHTKETFLTPKIPQENFFLKLWFLFDTKKNIKYSIVYL